MVSFRNVIPNAFCVVLFLSLCTYRAEGRGEIINPAIAARQMREECLDNVDTRPCPLTRPQAQLGVDQYPPNYFCPCPANGLPGQGAVPRATGVPCPPNPDQDLFQDYVLADGFNRPLIMEFTDNTNELFVGLREGIIEYINLETGDRHQVLDISTEVLFGADRGLMDITTSPNYAETGFIYLIYTTDPNPDDGVEAHVDEASNQRIVRYTDTGNGNVDPGSRYTLIGEGDWDGIPTCFSSHSIGSIKFGWDGSIFVSAGEGAHWDFYQTGDFGQNTLFSIDPITGQQIPSRDIGCSNFGVDQDVGAFRSQIHYSLAGKILRLTPEGDGVCDGGRGADQFPTKNPFCDDSNGQSIESKIWALGVRNPFRMTVRPMLPGDSPTFPGVLYFGDVGQGGYEEINVCSRPGMNFGWPCWEGPLPTPAYRDSVYNGPDPFNVVAYGCPDGNPCGPIESLPYLPNGDRLTCPYMYQNMTVDMPFFYYNRYPENALNGNEGESAYLNQGFIGASTAGITFYSGNSYPPKYYGAVFILDFSYKWIRVLFRTEDDQYDSMQHFTDLVFTPPADGGKATLVTNPHTGDVCYAAMDAGEIRCFRYIVDNIAPTPYISYSQPDRTKPRTVHFSSDGTFDREGDEILLEWDFGDGEKSFDPNPVHVYGSAGEFTVILTATDSEGNSESATETISTANLPPLVRIVNPVPEWEKFVVVPSDDTMISFECEVEDDSPADTLQYRWEFQFVHNNHIHTDQLNIFKDTFEMNSLALPKEAGAEFDRSNLRIVLHVTDEGGLEGEDFIRVSHDDWKVKFPNKPPIPDFLSDLGIQPSITGQPVRFSAQGTVEPNQDRIDFYWDFGDGFFSTGETTTHIFQGIGEEAAVTLNTTDNFGAMSSITKTISFANFTAPCSTAAISDNGQLLCVNNGRSLGLFGKVTIPSVSGASEEPPVKTGTSLVYEMGPFVGNEAQGATSLHLFASSESGNAQVKVRISFDFTADGSWDRTEDFGPFPVSADWTELTGDPTIEGEWEEMQKGSIRLQIWQSSVDAEPVYLQIGNPRGDVFSRIALPFSESRLHHEQVDIVTTFSEDTTKTIIDDTQTVDRTETIEDTTGTKPDPDPNNPGDSSTGSILSASLYLGLISFVLAFM